MMKFTYKANSFLKKLNIEIHELKLWAKFTKYNSHLAFRIRMPSIPGKQEGSRVAQQPSGELLISRVIFRAWQLIGHIVIAEVTVEAEQDVSFLGCLCPPILPLS